MFAYWPALLLLEEIWMPDKEFAFLIPVFSLEQLALRIDILHFEISLYHISIIIIWLVLCILIILKHVSDKVLWYLYKLWKVPNIVNCYQVKINPL